LDLDRATLCRENEELTLRPKSFEVLTYLAEHHGRLVTKGELVERLWPNTAVTDNSLAQCIVEIRRVLGDDTQQLIRTIARRGYLFTAPVNLTVLDLPRHSAETTTGLGPTPVAPRPAGWRSMDRRLLVGVSALASLAAILPFVVRMPYAPRQERGYEQITNFTDSVVSPALSPDGRMLAFIRSEDWFGTPDQIYVKLLPEGEPVQITHDPRPKYGLAFSPDGSRIAYTVFPWTAYTVSPLGGEPRKVLSNSAGLTWLDQRHILFSEVSSGQHMGVVTATENRSEYRKIYFPADERGMVHLSYASPDRKWALALEMNPVWHPCRVIPLAGGSVGHQVGPQGKCTSAAWSPDGKWMYFGVEVEGKHHLWRQRFPAGKPQQITTGPTEEDGIAVAVDGRSLITSVGMRQSAVWIHDARGDRPLSSEGYVLHPETSSLSGSLPTFSRDGRSLFYLRSESPGAAIELWRTDLISEKSEPALRGVSIQEYDMSSDGKEVVFSTQPAGKPSQIWLAALDRSSPPQMISSSGEDSPHFGLGGQILYRLSDGKTHYLARMRRDGSGRSKVLPYAIGNIFFISPDRQWITAVTEPPGGGIGGTYAAPVAGGAPRRICSGCPVMWAPDGKYLYLGVQRPSLTEPGKTRVVPLAPGEMLPGLPPLGMGGTDNPALFPGSHLIDRWAISPGPDPSVFAYVKTTMHRNLFRIPVL
jgi:DNA-binding winged helix-turn-helix (wHTH) protein/Tol biopolymer transport system component